jgi:nitronate monooxygenase
MADKSVLAFPQQNTLIGALRRWAASAGDVGYQSVWAGTGRSKIRSMPAAQLMATIERELSEAAI